MSEKKSYGWSELGIIVLITFFMALSVTAVIRDIWPRYMDSLGVENVRK